MAIMLAFLGNIFTLTFTLFSIKSYDTRVSALLALFFTFLINKSLSVVSVSGLESFSTLLALMLICLLNLTKIRLRFCLPWLCIVSLYFLLALVSSYALLFTVEKLTFFFLLVLAVSTVIPVDNLSRSRVVKTLVNSALVVLYASLILWFVPAISYEKTYGRDLLLFQGIANHPQSFGVFVAGIASFYGFKLLASFTRSNLVHFCSAVGALVMSGARTAILAFSLVALLALLRRKQAFFRNQLSRLSRGGLFQVGVAIIFVSLLSLPASRSHIMGIVLKRESVESVSDSFQDSRGKQVSQAVNNIIDKPVGGIGFALPSDERLYKQNIRYTGFGMPYGVNTEKGFLPLAIIEETGIIGFFAFILTMLFTLAGVDFDRPISWFYLVLLCSNIGEMYFFSPGGLGLLLWITLALSWKIG